MWKWIPLLFLYSAWTWATSLKEAFDLSRLKMESIKRAENQLEIRRQQKNSLRATMLPTLSGVGTYTKIDQPKMGGVNSAFTLTRQYSAALRLNQPLLRGGSLSAFQAAKENILLAEFQKDATDLNLYRLVIESYFDLKLAQIDLENISELFKASSERVSEIKERAKIGRSRRGELVEAEAQLHTAQAQRTQSIFVLEEAVRNFEFLTGLSQVNLPSLQLESFKMDPVEQLVSKLQSRPDILALEQELKVAEKQISVAQGGHYPSLDFVGNYYFDRTGILATSEWDAGLALTVPLYQGGGVDANVKEAVALKRNAQLSAHERKREAERELLVTYRQLEQLQEQLKSTSEALRAFESAYKLNKKDYHFGLVTNLDVLQSLNSYIQAKRNYNNLLVSSYRVKHHLEALTGVLP